MGTPATKGAIHDALGDLGSIIVSAHVRHYFNPKNTTILDVGAGWGKYRKLLPEYKMDAVEIWEPYIEADRLHELYDTVFPVDICDLHDVYYDVIIMGDVLEHISRERAVPLMERLKNSCEQLYLVVPYQYHQDEVNGNKYEIHLQEDLTDNLVKELYNLRLFARDDMKGVYIK